MTINIYGNITVAGNSSITTNHSSRSSRSRPARPQSVTQPRRNNRRRHNSIAVENLVIEDHVQHHDIDNHAGNHHARERLLIEAPRRQRDQSVVIAPPPRRNAPLPRRRSSRIARRALLNARMYPRRRRPIPAAHEDHDFWTKIWTLPVNLLLYLSPGWHPVWTTRDLLRQIIWHFKPNQRIPCRTLKADLIELFEVHVVQRYGAYYGI
ncbi:uncharacterized protein MELLADRAFT_51681 [Melampsora larici-populina 98AG31]|uniref:Uncharacterized protein n=1 Tax=Melampsora larici-populina (strain 98AG31 / pathotype 3-4-7) TaxID=747676 RepID=F4R993_MELLP|nr:uncharacterized protein MELLADRAFT_51681 [Melampsora larici-populina 98AG31]EGG10944.1 hypothetical protein MELLADRAFT_51681 [Melampsora larici-populina 98AG31]